jgi:hypothetical protein
MTEGAEVRAGAAALPDDARAAVGGPVDREPVDRHVFAESRRSSGG